MDNNKIERKNKITLVSVTLLSMLIFLGIAIAYFSATASNTNNEKFSTRTSTIALNFSDNDNGVGGTLNLGESIIKKFTLENTGTKEAYTKINWVNLVNTYLPESLTYNLEQSTSENDTFTSIKTGNVPVSSSSTIDTLKNGILVPVNTTYYYKLTITLNNLDINQNNDINAKFSSYFSLEEGSQSAVSTIQNLVAGENANTTNVITKTAPSGATCTNTLAYDGTTDNNLRYVGKNPCNYVSFNEKYKWVDLEISSGTEYDIFDTKDECTTFLQNEGYTESDECIPKKISSESWRIIGVMNNIDNGTGTLETRIKLIRSDSLGYYSWDSSEYEINNGWGINDWTQADLMRELNGDYLDTNLNSNTMWYNDWINTKDAEYDYTKGLKESAQDKIEDAKWFLGGDESLWDDDILDVTASSFYGYERGTRVWGSTNEQTCNDGACPRAVDWIGKVALAYPSDYGFAVGGDMRNTCLGINMNSYHWDISYCITNNWFFLEEKLLSPYSGDSYRSASINFAGGLEIHDSSQPFGIHPAVYLKSDVSISGGNGTEENPYILE